MGVTIVLLVLTQRTHSACPNKGKKNSNQSLTNEAHKTRQSLHMNTTLKYSTYLIILLNDMLILLR